ncbi:MAG: lipopolysaccharide transport periplasmic protein LptA [Thiogranum sp.]|nr:lipopolysaccharide transport periplasmic protein LptA [Thiogranum sp.]
MNKLPRSWILLLLLVPLQGWALSTDREQPMHIEADRVELDDATGISTYHGNVKVTQGTMKLTGDLMTIYSADNEIRKVIVDGEPATYRQRPDNKDEDVHARAQRMEYYTEPERIVMLREAQVTQEGNVLRSERIEYDVPRDKVNAGTDQPDERVHITIQPKTVPERPEPATP